MKILLTLFVLLFSSSVFAEDISDFEIEGMSIGDSLLDYVSKKEILNNKGNYFKDKDGTFEISAFDKTFFSKNYDWIEVGYISNDINFIIHTVNGVISYENNIENCYSKQNEILEDIKVLFKDEEWQYSDYENEYKDIIVSYYSTIKSGELIRVSCYDWSKETETENNWFDHLKIVISSKKYDYWLLN